MKLNRVHSNYHQFIDTEVSYNGSRYAPVTHREVIETVNETFYKTGIEIKKENYLTDSKGKCAIGTLTLGNIDSELDYQIAWRNSLNGSRSFQIVSGSQVSVCSNTNIWGEDFSFKRKHTGDGKVQIYEQISMAIDQYDRVSREHTLYKERYKEIEVSERTCAELLGRMFLQENIIQSEQLQIIKREIRNPSFDYGSIDTLWNLYNNSTFSFLNSHPKNWVESHRNLNQFLTTEFKIV